MVAIKTANWKALLGWAAVIAILALPWFSLSGAVAIFLRLDNIKGSANDPVLSIKEQIQVYAWSNGASNSSTFDLAGKANLQDISVTKPLDLSTPALFMHLVTGTLIPKGEISVYANTAKDPVNILKIAMENIRVTSQSQGGSAGEDILTENVSFNFGKFTITYTPILADQSAGTPISYGWDVQANKSL